MRTFFPTRLQFFQIGAILLAVLWIFWPALHGDWLWDDHLYVPENPLNGDPSRFWRIWFDLGSFADYYPLEQTVRWIQWTFFHDRVFGYHLTNVIFHGINALLVWRLLAKLKLRFAWLGGLLFAVHPLQVESVAWISELKNVLSLAPLLLSLGFWLDFDEHRRKSDYYLALGLFLLAMWAKISVSPLPAVLLLHAWWKRGGITKEDLLRVLPFFAVALIFGALSIGATHLFKRENHYQLLEVPLEGWPQKFSAAGQALAFYFAKSLYPVQPLPVYPYWPVDARSWSQFAPWLLPLLLLPVLWIKRNTWGRHVLLGLGFFYLFLLPISGFIVSDYLRISWVMDHFLYISLVGLLGLLVAALSQISRLLNPWSRRLGVGLVVAVAGALAWISHGYAAKYQNLETLFSYNLEHVPDSWIALSNLGVVRNSQGRFPEAIEYFEASLRVRPREVRTRVNLANALSNSGRLEEAKIQYEESLKIWLKAEDAQYYLGEMLLDSEKVDEAIAHYETYLAINPRSARLQLGLGNAYFAGGRLLEALKHYSIAVEIEPNSALARYNYGRALRQADRATAAAAQYERAIAINPDYAEAHNNLAVVYELLGKTPQAIEHYQTAYRLNPRIEAARLNLERLQSN